MTKKTPENEASRQPNIAIRKIVQHAPIDRDYFESSFDDALLSVRQELEREAVKSRPEKSGPIGCEHEKMQFCWKRMECGEKSSQLVMTFDRLLTLWCFRKWTAVVVGMRDPGQIFWGWTEVDMWSASRFAISKFDEASLGPARPARCRHVAVMYWQGTRKKRACRSEKKTMWFE